MCSEYLKNLKKVLWVLYEVLVDTVGPLDVIEVDGMGGVLKAL